MMFVKDLIHRKNGYWHLDICTDRKVSVRFMESCVAYVFGFLTEKSMQLGKCETEICVHWNQRFHIPPEGVLYDFKAVKRHPSFEYDINAMLAWHYDGKQNDITFYSRLPKPQNGIRIYMSEPLRPARENFYISGIRRYFSEFPEKYPEIAKGLSESFPELSGIRMVKEFTAKECKNASGDY